MTLPLGSCIQPVVVRTMHVIRKWPLALIVGAASVLCVAQLAPAPVPVPPPAPDWTDWSGPAGSVRIRARVRQDPPPSSHSAAVEVEVEHVFLTDSTLAGTDRGMLRYQLDQCPSVVTVATTLRFDRLPSGDHKIR